MGEKGCCSNHTCFPEACSKESEHLKDCMSICCSCAKKCIDEGHKKTACFCAECADMCALTIKAISSGSEFKKEIVELCAKMCQKCAEECRKMQMDHCQECAESCEECCKCCKESCNKE